MSFRSNARVSRFRRTAVAAALLLSSSSAVLVPGAWADGIFAGLAGSWRGDGSIGWTTGETERIRCTAKYEVKRDGNEIIQNLSCATDSTKLVVKSDIIYVPAAGAITGTWMETTYGINGWVTGRASISKIQANVKSSDASFKARVIVVTNGGTQTVSITPEGLEVTEVSVTLQRGG